MKKQTGIKILAIIMCLFVIVSYSFMYLDNMSSVYAVTESDLQDAKDKADKLKKKQEELKKDMEKLSILHLWFRGLEVRQCRHIQQQKAG